MIFDGNLNPLSESEYHERLLSQTILLVVAAGGEIVIPPSTALTVGTHHVLGQDKLDDGSLRLRVRAASKGE